jgi:hypothetical protein
MKFLENEKLAQLTAQMTDVIVGTGECVINGRTEAFTMKRAGTDKKLAHELGERYQAEIQVVESEIAQYQQSSIGKKRSESIGEEEVRNALRQKSAAMLQQSLHKRVRIESTSTKDEKPTGRRRSSSVGSQYTTIEDEKPKFSPQRPRSESYDIKSILKTDTSSKIRSRSDSVVSYSTEIINSPLGDFHDSSTQRLMTDLILTLNASFPDYDFSNIRPAHFARLPSPNIAINRTNEKLSELTTSTKTTTLDQGGSFLSRLWNAIDDVIGVNESEVYSYVPPQRDDDDDPLGFLAQTLDGTNSDKIVPLWTLNFFFVNKSMKRIVLFTCVQTMRNEVGTSADDDDDHDDINYVSEDVKDTLFSYDNYGMSNHGFRSSRENSVLEDCNDEDDEDENCIDFDMDTDAMGQPAPPATFA